MVVVGAVGALVHHKMGRRSGVSAVGIEHKNDDTNGSKSGVSAQPSAEDAIVSNRW